MIYETVFVFSFQLIGTFSVLPCDQHLSLQDGTPLVEDSKTLADLGIRPGCVLLLKVCRLFVISKRLVLDKFFYVTFALLSCLIFGQFAIY